MLLMISNKHVILTLLMLFGYRLTKNAIYTYDHSHQCFGQYLKQQKLLAENFEIEVYDGAKWSCSIIIELYVYSHRDSVRHIFSNRTVSAKENSCITGYLQEIEFVNIVMLKHFYLLTSPKDNDKMQAANLMFNGYIRKHVNFCEELIYHEFIKGVNASSLPKTSAEVLKIINDIDSNIDL